jgi:hypothetical protein
MVDVLIASGVIFAVLGGWLWVQASYRRFAARYPELGPFRPNSACGGSCEACGSDGCEAGDDKKPALAAPVRVAFGTPGRSDYEESTGDKR